MSEKPEKPDQQKAAQEKLEKLKAAERKLQAIRERLEDLKKMAPSPITRTRGPDRGPRRSQGRFTPEQMTGLKILSALERIEQLQTPKPVATTPAVTYTFAARLLQLRQARSLTQADLSAATGIPVTTLASWEQRRRSPHAAELFRIAKALGCSSELFAACDFSTRKRKAAPTKV